jgi:hypothetical protein
MNHEKWIKLSEEEQGDKVAELLGWRFVEGLDCPSLSFSGARCCADCWVDPDGNAGCGDIIRPDYLNDLNAMHEAVNSLTDVQYDCFCDILWNMCGGASGKHGAINATAAQRAEAFVLTMEPE